MEDVKTLCILNFKNDLEKKILSIFLDIYNNECPGVFGLENHPECSHTNCVGEDACWNYALRKKSEELDKEWS